jgi:ADP-heptose:LPS heptosyltransferase
MRTFAQTNRCTMSNLSAINRFRRHIMKAATSSIGRSSLLGNQEPLDPATVKRVLISRPNHRLGNMLLITPLIQDVQRVFPNATVDFFVKGGVAPILFQGYERIGRFISLPRKHFKQLGLYLKGWLALRAYRYDLVINTVNYSSSGRLSTLFARSRRKLFGDEGQERLPEHPDWMHIAKTSVYRFRYALSVWGLPADDAPVPALNLKLTLAERNAGLERLNALVADPSQKTICLYTFATGTKRYTAEWWLPFLASLKATFPSCNILEILPVEKVSSIGFSEPSLYSRDVREMAAVMSHAAVLITADCGIMHLASAAQTPIVALFSVTDPVIYGPYNAGSISLQTEGLEQEAILDAVKGMPSFLC